MNTPETEYFIGLDISTQTVSALAIGVTVHRSVPKEIILEHEWRSSRPWAAEQDRKSPDVWVRLTAEVIAELAEKCPHARWARAIGVSTAFPGVFPVLHDGRIEAGYVSLYDNTDDGGVSDDVCADLLAGAEDETMNRMWPGNMAIGLVHLVKSCGLPVEEVRAILPPNTAFAYALLGACGHSADVQLLATDFTQAAISGLYDARTMSPMPKGTARLLQHFIPGWDAANLARLLPRAVPSWRSALPSSALENVRDLFGLPALEFVSVGAGDSALGALTLGASADTVLNVRGSSDSPVLTVPAIRPRNTPREIVLHYPLPTVAAPGDSPWCVVAPMLRSGKVWDWVKRLRFSEGDPDADSRLEALACEALKRRFRLSIPPLSFDTALGGERAPEWNPHATGRIHGLVEKHDLGDIALAAIEGVSVRLRSCVNLMESRYEVSVPKLVLAGGPARNDLWSWITGLFLGKQTYRTGFTDASLLGAAMLGYAAGLDGTSTDSEISRQLSALAELAAAHPAVRVSPMAAPDDELAELERAYRCQIASLCGEV
ncbi:MAG: FGGY-family carbohydrate kinase [Armatimonadota bacterium]|nr:FGGY-family carbohydrate kinase [Armatimonadota bacterium]